MRPGNAFLYHGVKKTIFASHNGKVVFATGEDIKRFDFDSLDLTSEGFDEKVYLTPSVIAKFEVMGFVPLEESDHVESNEYVWVEIDRDSGMYVLKIVNGVKDLGVVGLVYKFQNEEKYSAPKYLRMYRTNVKTPS